MEVIRYYQVVKGYLQGDDTVMIDCCQNGDRRCKDVSRVVIRY